MIAGDLTDCTDRDNRPSPVDVHVGSCIRRRRILLGISQEKLSNVLGLTFQQVQKYERGLNRVAASRLFEISRVLDVPIDFFFNDIYEGMNEPPTPGPRGRSSLAEMQEPFGAGFAEQLTRRETIELVRAYYRINEPKVRKRMVDLIKSLAPMDPISTE